MNTDAPVEPMRVVTQLTRRDLFHLAFRYSLRSGLAWTLCALAFSYSLWEQWHGEYRPTHLGDGLFFVVFWGVIWLAIHSVVVLILSTVMALQMSAVRGVLGNHMFEVRDNGLFETTPFNETLIKWSAISKAIRTNRCILVSLGRWMFHYIPRRSFADETAYNSFFDALQQGISRDS